MSRIPHTMRAARLLAYGDGLRIEVREVPVPHPGPGEVLIKVAAAQVHPADLQFGRGAYGFKRAIPTTPGFEGTGEVVADGGGLVTRLLRGRRVAATVAERHDGFWAEYTVADASRCLPLWAGIPDHLAAGLLRDPLTALALVDEVIDAGHQGVVQTAAAGHVGRLTTRIARQRGLPMVHVVRGASRVKDVEALGAEVILDQEDPEFDAKLRRACRAWKVTCALDGVGGTLTGRLLAAMGDHAEAILYGLLATEPVGIEPAELVFRGKRVRGFWVTDWAQRLGPRAMVTLLPRLRAVADHAGALTVAERVGLESLADAIRRYEADRSRGRVLVLPGQAPAA